MRTFRTKNMKLLITCCLGVMKLSVAAVIPLAIENDTNVTVPSGAGFVLKAPEGKTQQYCTQLYPGVTQPVWTNPLQPGVQSNSVAVNLEPLPYGGKPDMQCQVVGSSVSSLSVTFDVTDTKAGRSAPNCTSGANCICVSTPSCNQLEVNFSHFSNQAYVVHVGYILPSQGSCRLKAVCLPAP